MNYYLLSAKNSAVVYSAFAPENIKPSQDIMEDVCNTEHLPFELTLFKLTSGKSGLVKKNLLKGDSFPWLDYIPNSLAWPLFSERMKNLVERILTGNEGISWISASISAIDEKRTYFIPRFNQKLDVLNVDRTLFVSGTDHIIKPCFSLAKVENYSIFHKPTNINLWKITSALYVSETVKNIIQKNKITGIVFEKTFVE